MSEFVVEREININVNAPDVWNALTNPEIIKEYLYGTEAVSEWREGADLIFQGEYQGMKYRDLGVIKKFEKNRLFQYSYYSGFSGLEDKPENYFLITYEIEDEANGVCLSVRQENIKSEESRDHTDHNWQLALKKIKEILEA
jgi:uncharacterized protein YndB with AHSA1/START domain